MPTEIIRANPDQAAAFRTASERLLKFVARQTGPVVLGLCGGRSVVGLLEALRQLPADEGSRVTSKLQFFMVDERLVPLTDEHSNYGGLKKLLFDDLVERKLIDEKQLHPFVPRPDEPDHGTSAYMQELDRFGGKFDVIVLGVGEDGHVAGLFPNNAVLNRREKTFFSFYDSPKPPPARMTASVPLLSGARLAFVLALGEAKRDAYERYSRADTSLESCPSVLAKQCDSTVVVTDL